MSAWIAFCLTAPASGTPPLPVAALEPVPDGLIAKVPVAGDQPVLHIADGLKPLGRFERISDGRYLRSTELADMPIAGPLSAWPVASLDGAALTTAIVTNVAPGQRGAWLGVPQAHHGRWWKRHAGQPIVRLDAPPKDGQVFAEATMLAAGVSILPGDRLAPWPTPLEAELDLLPSAIGHVEENADHWLIWIPDPGADDSVSRILLPVSRRQAQPVRRDERFLFGRIPRDEFPPPKVGQNAWLRASRDQGQRRLVAAVTTLTPETLLDVGTIDSVEVGQSFTIWREHAALVRAIVTRVGVDTCVVATDAAVAPGDFAVPVQMRGDVPHGLVLEAVDDLVRARLETDSSERFLVYGRFGPVALCRILRRDGLDVLGRIEHRWDDEEILAGHRAIVAPSP